MKIAHKLALGLLIVGLLVGLESRIILLLSDQVSALQTVLLPMQRELHELDSEMWQSSHEVDVFCLNPEGDNHDGFTRHVAEVERTLTQLRARFSSLRRAQSMFAAFSASWQQTRRLAEQVIRLTKQHRAARQRLLDGMQEVRQLVPSDLTEDAKRENTGEHVALRLAAFQHLDAALDIYFAHALAASSAQTSAADELKSDSVAVNRLWQASNALIFAGDANRTRLWEEAWNQASAAGVESIGSLTERNSLFQPMEAALDASDAIVAKQLVVIAEREIAAARKAVDHAAWRGLWTAGFCLGISLALCLIISRNIGGGVSRSIAFAERLAGGDLLVRLPLDRKDEFGSLAVCLNRMAEKLAANEKNLRREIMARGRVLQALQESEQRFGQITESISEVFWIAAADTHKTIYISPAYKEMFGRSCASVFATSADWMTDVLESDRPGILNLLAKCAAGDPSEFEFRLIHPASGELRWLRARAFPLVEKYGRIHRICGVTEDITERKLNEAAAEELNKRLRDLSHEAGRAEVATNVLHNVGNVLNSVNVALERAVRTTGQLKTGGLHAAADLLQTHAADLTAFAATCTQAARLPAFLTQMAQHFQTKQEAIAGELTALRNHIEHISEIVSMQQSYASSGGLIETLPVDDVIEDALRMNSAALNRHGAYVVREFGPSIPPIALDRHKVLQILINLIRNAKYAMDEANASDKRLTLRTELTADHCVAISVLDTGVGISPENMTRIFEHGFTTRAAGHGFGLHSSALAAKDLGGSLKASSLGVGSGACFSLLLPSSF